MIFKLSSGFGKKDLIRTSAAISESCIEPVRSLNMGILPIAVVDVTEDKNCSLKLEAVLYAAVPKAPTPPTAEANFKLLCPIIAGNGSTKTYRAPALAVPASIGIYIPAAI